MQEAKENDLAHELLGEVHGADVLFLQLVADGFVLGRDFSEFLLNLLEQLAVPGEKHLGDRFDAEGLFDLRERGVVLRVLKQAEKPGLCRMATLAFADDVGEAAGGREARFDADFARFLLDSRILHLDVGEAPLPFRGRNERDEGSVFLLTLLQVVGHEIADAGSGALQLGFLGEVNDENVEFFVIGGSVCAKTLEALDVRFESVLDVLAVSREHLRFVELVEQVEREIAEAGFVERLREGLGNEGARLLRVHNRAGLFLTR